MRCGSSAGTKWPPGGSGSTGGRYYENEQLLHEPDHTPNGYREGALGRLAVSAAKH
jgi:hypothetical protein